MAKRLRKIVIFCEWFHFAQNQSAVPPTISKPCFLSILHLKVIFEFAANLLLRTLFENAIFFVPIVRF